MASSSSSKPKTEILRLAGADFLPKHKGPELRPLILEDDDPPQEKERVLPSSDYINLRVKARQILDSLNHADIQQLFVDKTLLQFCKSEYPNVLCVKLSQLLLDSQNSPEIKSKCSILLHFLLDSPRRSTSVWSSTSYIIRTELKIAILEILKQDNPKQICKQMWKTASQIFSCVVIEKQGGWQGMLSLFCESLNSGPLYVQDCALMFFLDLPTCLREELSQSVEDLRLNLLNKFNSSNGERKVYALAALVNLVQHMSSDYYSMFHDLLMPMIKGVSDFLDNDVEEDNAQRSLKKLAELVGAEPRFFDSYLDQVFDAMITISENDKLGEETRYLSVEMMYVFDDISIKRVDKRILGRLCSELARMISLIPDGSRNYLLGETFMFRISMVRSNEIPMPFLLGEIPKDMPSSEWRKRYAAVQIIGVIAKGCAKAMSDNLTKVKKVVLIATLDPSPTVRVAAIRTVKSMSLDLSPYTLDPCADVLITSLYLALADGDNPLKQAAAASAMRSLCERCSSCILEPRLQTIVSKLLELIQSPNPEVQAESLMTLATVARLSKDLFCKCYDLVITSLKKLLAESTSISEQDNAVELHLDKAVECIWTVARAVGKDIFKKDATEVVAILVNVRWYLGEDDHSLKITLLRAWKKLLKCLGSCFYPYVKDIMPDLLRSARLGSNSATERVILTEKLKACKLLLRLTRQFKGKFFPWIDQVSDIVVPLVKFHDKDTRKIAFSVMPKLLHSAKLSIENKQAHDPTNSSYLHKLVPRIVPSLLEVLDEETDSEMCAKILKSLTKCIKIAGGFLNEKKIQQTTNAIEKVLKATSRKHFSQEENVSKLEKEIIKQVVTYFRVLIKIYKENSGTLVNKFLECIKAMMEDDVTAKEKEIALLTFNEVYLKCKEAFIR
ncbi:uncharacterized protein LOC129877062 [Solanum dulcamara]|uniref:uncharacterized protein LOC129877062 n=1 Tax=Solanum dulcamara TaxID=45834 RepID=UPI00248567C3|nr:uncharacterized protein LOC129877062 [Solanum dulcamara]